MDSDNVNFPTTGDDTSLDTTMMDTPPAGVEAPHRSITEDNSVNPEADLVADGDNTAAQPTTDESGLGSEVARKPKVKKRSSSTVDLMSIPKKKKTHNRTEPTARADLIDYYQKIFAVHYFATGDSSLDAVVKCVPETAEPTTTEINKIWSVIYSIKEKVSNGIGFSVVMVFMRDPAWYIDPVPPFGSRSERIEYFAEQFEKNSIAIMAFVSEIIPALDWDFILSEQVYTGEEEYRNALKVKVRGHLWERLAALADLVYFGKISSGDREDAHPLSEGSYWVRRRVSTALADHQVADSKYGKLSVGEWPLKRSIKPQDKSDW